MMRLSHKPNLKLRRPRSPLSKQPQSRRSLLPRDRRLNWPTMDSMLSIIPEMLITEVPTEVEVEMLEKEVIDQELPEVVIEVEVEKVEAEVVKAEAEEVKAEAVVEKEEEEVKVEEEVEVEKVVEEAEVEPKLSDLMKMETQSKLKTEDIDQMDQLLMKPPNTEVTIEKMELVEEEEEIRMVPANSVLDKDQTNNTRPRMPLPLRPLKVPLLPKPSQSRKKRNNSRKSSSVSVSMISSLPEEAQPRNKEEPQKQSRVPRFKQTLPLRSTLLPLKRTNTVTLLMPPRPRSTLLSASDSKPVEKKSQLLTQEEAAEVVPEVAEEEPDVLTQLLLEAQGNKTPERLWPRPRRTSQLYERGDLIIDHQKRAELIMSK